MPEGLRGARGAAPEGLRVAASEGLRGAVPEILNVPGDLRTAEPVLPSDPVSEILGEIVPGHVDVLDHGEQCQDHRHIEQGGGHIDHPLRLAPDQTADGKHLEGGLPFAYPLDSYSISFGFFGHPFPEGGDDDLTADDDHRGHGDQG